MTFPSLPTDWEPTRAHLHAHAATAGVVARALLPPDPQWWFVALRPDDEGFATGRFDLPDGREARIVMDLAAHLLRLDVGATPHTELSLADAPSEVAMAVFEALDALGLDDGYDRSRLHDDPSGEYSQDDATVFWAAARSVVDAFEAERRKRPDPGPILLWPHGFDIAFEWFGSRVVEGDDGSARAQLNLGWYPAGEAYFYSNPWPFDESLLEHDLPSPARWHTDGWQGTELRYADVADDPDGPARFAAYAGAVFELARPSLTS